MHAGHAAIAMAVKACALVSRSQFGSGRVCARLGAMVAGLRGRPDLLHSLVSVGILATATALVYGAWSPAGRRLFRLAHVRLPLACRLHHGFKPTARRPGSWTVYAYPMADIAPSGVVALCWLLYRASLPPNRAARLVGSCRSVSWPCSWLLQIIKPESGKRSAVVQDRYNSPAPSGAAACVLHRFAFGINVSESWQMTQARAVS